MIAVLILVAVVALAAAAVAAGFLVGREYGRDEADAAYFEGWERAREERTLAEQAGEVLIGHLTPLSSGEYGLLADAVRTVQTRRIEASGLVTRQEAEEIEAVCTDFAAFEAATGRDLELELRGMRAHNMRVGRA